MDAVLGSLIADAMRGQAWSAGLDAIVPVPSTWRSTLRYRFLPVNLLADAAARELSLPVLPILTARGKRHRQVDLSTEARMKNVRGRFLLKRGADVRDAVLCIVDDVCTTGATLREIRDVLTRAGARKVYGAVLVKTDPRQATPAVF